MAGIGIIFTSAIITDGEDRQRFFFSAIEESAMSGMSLRRQKGGTERAISGVASTAELNVTAQSVTSYQYEWLVTRVGRPVRVQIPSGFSGTCAIATVRRVLRAEKHDTKAWDMEIRFYIIERLE